MEILCRPSRRRSHLGTLPLARGWSEVPKRLRYSDPHYGYVVASATQTPKKSLGFPRRTEHHHYGRQPGSVPPFHPPEEAMSERFAAMLTDEAASQLIHAIYYFSY